MGNGHASSIEAGGGAGTGATAGLAAARFRGVAFFFTDFFVSARLVFFLAAGFLAAAFLVAERDFRAAGRCFFPAIFFFAGFLCLALAIYGLLKDNRLCAGSTVNFSAAIDRATPSIAAARAGCGGSANAKRTVLCLLDRDRALRDRA